MSPLAVRVARFLRAPALVAPGDRVIVALSGGPDSVALLHLLREVARQAGFTLSGIAHLNHRLRGADAETDERFCRSLAEQLGLPAFVASDDVAALARDRRCSLEAAGHVARDAFYRRALERLGATLVATGHTADDLAESVLMHAGRGSGLRGLAAIRPRAGHLVRPLLQVERRDVLGYLQERSLPFRQDSSNEDLAIVRNRIRRLVLPAMRDALSPRVVTALGRLAGLAAEDEALLDELARERASRVLLTQRGVVRIDLRSLAGEPLAIRRRLVDEALMAAGRGRGCGLVHVNAVLALAQGARQGARLALPRLTVEVAGGALVVSPVTPTAEDSDPQAQLAPSGPRRHARAAAHEARTNPMRQIPIPGVLRDEDGRWEMTARLAAPIDQEAARQVAAGGVTAVVDADRAGRDLFVRYWRPGDRVRPLGMAGRRKLQDVFVDARVPRVDRTDVVLVVDASDRILWVAGHCVSEDVRLTEATKGVLILGFRALGG